MLYRRMDACRVSPLLSPLGVGVSSQSYGMEMSLRLARRWAPSPLAFPLPLPINSAAHFLPIYLCILRAPEASTGRVADMLIIFTQFMNACYRFR